MNERKLGKKLSQVPHSKMYIWKLIMKFNIFYDKYKKRTLLKSANDAIDVLLYLLIIIYIYHKILFHTCLLPNYSGTFLTCLGPYGYDIKANTHGDLPQFPLPTTMLSAWLPTKIFFPCYLNRRVFSSRTILCHTVNQFPSWFTVPLWRKLICILLLPS